MIFLYMEQGWMPCCVVRMVARAVGVQLTLRRINIRTEENKTAAYRAVSMFILEKNPNKKEMSMNWNFLNFRSIRNVQFHVWLTVI